MKKYVSLFLLAGVIFAGATYLSASDQRYADGAYFRGFPLTFHTIYSEMTDPIQSAGTDLSRTNYLYLFIDIVFAFLIAWFIINIFNKFKKRK